MKHETLPNRETLQSCIYEGRVRHRRFTPVEHAFDYALFMMYLDLAELPHLFDRYWLWNNEGRGLARFRRRDHLKNEAPPETPLDEAVRTLVQKRTGRVISGPIRLLTHLEYFGYRFNPVSFYFCFDDADTQVDAFVAEINNTPWGEQHCYVLDRRDSDAAGSKLHFRFAKNFHISPFMEMEYDYDWHIAGPDKALAIHMSNLRDGEKAFDATMTMHRTPITGRALARVLAQYPLMTAKVIGAIYYQAWRLWFKRCPYVPHPKTLSQPHSGG
jgi:hypothetical protein